MNNREPMSNHLNKNNNNGNSDATQNTNANTRSPQQEKKETYDFLFSDGTSDNDYKKLNKEEMIKKIKDKIKELREKEDELHKKFKNGYIPLNLNGKENIKNSFFHPNININNFKPYGSQMPFSNATEKDGKGKEAINANTRSCHLNETTTNKTNGNTQEEDKKVKFNTEGREILEDDDIGWYGKGILKVDKGIKYFFQISNIILGALFFISVIFYFAGVHFDAFNYEAPSIRKYRNKNLHNMEFKGFSLLMTPDRTSEAYQILNQTITELSNEYHTELFEPHLTLYAPIDLPLEDLKKKLNSLSMIEPFELSMDKVITGHKYYQCVLGTITLNSDLEYVYQRTMELLGLPQNHYFPHISLIYGSFITYEKRHIMNEILNEKGYNNLLPLKFTISQIEIWKTEGETKTWKCHDTIPFSMDNGDDDNEEDY